MEIVRAERRSMILSKHAIHRKHSTMMNFLASMLRDEGGYEYKKALVDTIITIVDDNPSAKDLGINALFLCLLPNTCLFIGLSHLCEFIEDCEHAALATRSINLVIVM